MRMPDTLRKFEGDVCYIILDSDVAGCASSLVERRRALRPDQLSVLLGALATLERGLPTVGADAFECCARLRQMARGSLEVHNARSGASDTATGDASAHRKE